jgi:hypothetical protein
MLVDNLPQLFLTQIYSTFLHALRNCSFKLATKELDAHITTFENLHSQIASCGNSILSLAGHGQEFQHLQSIANPVRRMVECLQDLWCQGTDGADDLESCYKRRGLLFQLWE